VYSDGTHVIVDGVVGLATQGGLSTGGDLTFSGDGLRIKGDFSNEITANRLFFQDSKDNSNASIEVIPSGTANATAVVAGTSFNPNDTSIIFLRVGLDSGDARVASGKRGTGSYLPMTFYTGGAERMRIDAGGAITMNAGGSSNITHRFSYDENGGEFLLHDSAGVVSTVVDLSFGTSRFLHVLSTGNAIFGIAAPDSTGVVIFTGAGGVERLRIDTTGNVLVTGSSGLGYGTGSGGAVTQTTSRTMGVTINKPSGAITLVSAAGSTSWQTFTVTNSSVAASDTPIVVQKAGTDLNEIHVTAVSSGSFNISFRTTGGTTVEQPVFNFNIIKGAVS
jgi:hypothetical protein